MVREVRGRSEAHRLSVYDAGDSWGFLNRDSSADANAPDGLIGPLQDTGAWSSALRLRDETQLFRHRQHPSKPLASPPPPLCPDARHLTRDVRASQSGPRRPSHTVGTSAPTVSLSAMGPLRAPYSHDGGPVMPTQDLQLALLHRRPDARPTDAEAAAEIARSLGETWAIRAHHCSPDWRRGEPHLRGRRRGASVGGRPAAGPFNHSM